MAHFEALKGPKGLPLRYLESSGITTDTCVVLSVSQVPSDKHENINSLKNKAHCRLLNIKIKYKSNASPTFVSVLILLEEISHLLSQELL